MTTSLTQLMKEIKSAVIPSYWVSYFREKLRGEVNDQFLEAFHASGLTKADLARKLNKRPEQVTRWLSAPGNLESDTVSDIALALGLAARFRLERIEEVKSNNETHGFFLHHIGKVESRMTDESVYILEKSKVKSGPSSAKMSTSYKRKHEEDLSSSEADNLRKVS